MKKKLFSLIAFAFLVAGIFTACTSPSAISGQFKEEEYLVSIEKTKNFLDELILKGVENGDISFSSSNDDIIVHEGDGVFKGVKSGEAYILAKTQDKIVAKTKVFVKYKFSSPKNIKISDSGILSWDKSFTTINEQPYYANYYYVEYAKFDADGNLGPAKRDYCNTNEFYLEEGAYKISVMAVAEDDKLIDESEPSEKEVSNGVVGLVQNVKLDQTADFGQQTAKLSWLSPADTTAVYDVYLEGFKIQENISETYFVFDYSRYDGGKEIEVEIRAKDRAGKKLPSVSTFTLNKLALPDIEYRYSNQSGALCWSGDENAKSYILRVWSFELGNYQDFVIENKAEITHILEGNDGAAYNVQVMAVANNEKGFYLNSSETIDMTVAKIATPDVEVEIIDKTAKITFDGSVYSKKYKISYGVEEVVYNTDEGLVKSFDLSMLDAGDYRLEVVALPNEDSSSETGVEELEYFVNENSIISDKVLTSNASNFDFLVLEDIEEITHRFDGSVSIFAFDEVSNANEYKFYLNGNLIDEPNFEIKEGKAELRISNLNQIDPVGDGYIIKVDAGKVVDGKDIAVRAVQEKKLTILSVVEKDAIQINGFFNWTRVTGDAEYYYEVYLANSDYDIADETPVATATTTKDSTTALDLGEYYKIKIYTKSTNENDYLDATFVDEDAYFTANFIVTEKISMPNVEMNISGDEYVLTIEAVEFGGKYKIYVDDVLDGEIIVSQPKENYQYKLSCAFLDAKVYEVEVVASSGTLFDSNLFVDSAETKIYVERLAEATFNMQYPEDMFGRITKTEVSFVDVENSDHIEVFVAGEKVLDSGYSLDVSNIAVYGNEFTLTAKYIAIQPNVTLYYLDSLPVEYKFKRATGPSAVCYDEGFVKWTAEDDNSYTKFEAVLSLINTASQDYHYSFEIDKTARQYNIQALILSLLDSNPVFTSAYRQAEKITFEMYAFNSEVDENGVYVIPSSKATTTKGGTTLEINQLEKLTLSLDVDTEILSWAEEVDDSTYDVYIDDVKVKEGLAINSIALTELGSIDFTDAKRIKVQALNSEYLASPYSDEIVVEKLQISNMLAISGTSATFDLTYDASKVGSVKINDSVANVIYSQGDASASFNLSNFAGVSDFEISLCGKPATSNYYYLNSDSVTFVLKNIADVDLEVEVTQEAIYESTEINDDFISWKDVRHDFVGNSLQPVVYTVVVSDNAGTYDFTTDVCKISLEEIENYIGNSLSGNVSVEIKAQVKKDYLLVNDGSGVFGYYGQVSSSPVLTEKLAEVEIRQVLVDYDTTRASGIDQKRFAGLNIVVEDKWTGISDIYFVVLWTYVVDGENHVAKYYFDNVTSSGGVYNLKVDINRDGYVDMVGENFFLAEETDVVLMVKKDGAVNGEETQFVVKRFDTPEGSAIDDDGIITLEKKAGVSYFLELKIADKTVYTTVLENQLDDEGKVDISQSLFGLAGANGAYQVRIVAIDENQMILPSAVSELIEGYQIAGIEGAISDENGNIIFNMLPGDYDDLIFSARLSGSDERKDFTASLIDEEVDLFTIPASDILNLFGSQTASEGEYSFEFTVRKEGSINANWVEHKLNYKIGDSMRLVRAKEIDQDYLIFAKETGAIETIAFNVKIEGKMEKTIEVGGVNADGDPITTESPFTENGIENLYYLSSDALGFWVTDLNGENGYFSKTAGTDSNFIYTECYAVSINKILEKIVYGDVVVRISRVGKNGGEYYQYNSMTINLNKLASVLDNKVEIQNNILKWRWQQKDVDNMDIAPSAYYVIIDSGVVVKKLVTSTSLDLSNYVTDTSKTYEIKVVAVNYNGNIVASNDSYSIKTLKYSTPMSVEVEDGRLFFNINKFKESGFFKTITDYFDGSDASMLYHNKVGAMQYVATNSDVYTDQNTAPVNFSTGALNLAMVQVKFVYNEIGYTNQEYLYILPAVALFPDLNIDYKLADGTMNQASYLTLLENYSKNNLAVAQTLEEINTRAMINVLSSTSHGWGDKHLLIDDIARTLPFGNYKVSVSQIGTATEIQSDFSVDTEVYVSASSSLSLDKENDAATGKTIYSATITPTINMTGDGQNKDSYQEGFAKVYKMQLQYEKQTEIIDFKILYDDTLGDWIIFYGEETTNIVDLISDVEWTGEVPKFKINLNNLKLVLQDRGVIKVNTIAKINIFAYNQDDLYVLNGKSAIFEINFLDLPAEDIIFNNGNLTIVADEKSALEILIKYQYGTQEEISITKSFKDGNIEIDFANGGEYKYVLLSLKGSNSSSMVNIESDAYEIRGLYKLSTPVMTTYNNQLFITYNGVDATKSSSIKFKLANNVSLEEGADDANKGYYYESPISASANMTYIVGSKDSEGNVNQTEIAANTFYAYICGNNGSFAVSANSAIKGDFLLEFSQVDGAGVPILSSGVSLINAKMLSSLNSVRVENGDFVLCDSIMGAKPIISETDDTNLIYEILVEYYEEDNQTKKYVLSSNEIYYSERHEGSDTEILDQIISSSIIDSNYKYYKLIVSTLGGIKANEGDAGAIKTLENTYFRINKKLYYQDNADMQVLRSPAFETQMLTRTVSPTLGDGDGVLYGKVDFVIDKKLYYAEVEEPTVEQINENTASRISVYAQYIKDGASMIEKVEGDMSFSTSSESGKENDVYVSFVPKHNMLAGVIAPIKLLVTINGKDSNNGDMQAITSVPLVIENVYKLQTPDDKYYSIEFVKEGGLRATYINFEKYFENVLIGSDNLCYKIVANAVYNDDSVEEFAFVAADEFKRVAIDNLKTLTIQVQDAQSDTSTNPKKLLYSDIVELLIGKTQIQDGLDDLLEIKWNSENLSFEWGWTDSRTDEYEYYIYLNVAGSITEEVVQTNFYMPRNRGVIQEFKVWARLKGDDQSLWAYSNEVSYTGESISFMLYGGGNGSEARPYLIEDEEDFINISKRNIESDKFYFRLNANIELNIANLFNEAGENIIDKFYGEIDGNGLTIKIVSSVAYDLAQTFDASFVGMVNSVNFTKYASLFHTVAQTAVVKNLKIDYALSYLSLNSSNIIFSPISLYNFGLMTGITVENTGFEFKGTGDNNVFVGGIVGFNYGNINSCVNNAEISYNMAQNLSLNFGYGGIALYNMSRTGSVGTITNCFNSADKSITVRVNNNMVYMAGIVIVNQSRISSCGNNGAMALGASGAGVTTFTGYYAGIAISSSGIMEYLYNNGQFSCTRGTLHFGGIAYEIVSGTIDTLVDTVEGQALVKACRTRPTSRGTHYATASSDTHSYISTSSLVATNISCGNGYKLIVSSGTDGYTASIIPN